MENQPKTDMILAEERTLLAAERTFSAWIRTALAAMAGGLAIIRLIAFKTESHRVMAHLTGQMLIFWGCVLIVLASIDYKNIHNKLNLAKNYNRSQIRYFFIVLPLLAIALLVVLITLP